MKQQMIFKRYEMKYLMNKAQKEKVLRTMEPYMQPDRFSHSSIRNIYYDTDTYRLIRTSLEGPVYKEKLRVRSYGTVHPGDEVFVELKKKYDGVVYKRRILLAEELTERFLCEKADIPVQGQIREEIEYFRDYYETLRPRVFLSYERDSFAARDGGELRITFDEDILWRKDELSLEKEPGGLRILPENMCLMEIKTPDSIPLWMSKVLDEEQIFKTSFSKYGRAYMEDEYGTVI